MLALSRTIVIFAISRMLQGIAGSIVWSAGLALLLDTFGHARFGKMMALAIICQTSALTVAPVVGGYVFAKLGYTAVMAVSFFMVAIDIMLRLLLVEKSRNAETRTKGNSSVDSQFTAPVSDEPFPGEYSTLLPKPNKSVKTISSWYVFVIILGQPRVLASLLCFASIWALNTAFDAVLPYKVHDLFGWSSTGSGLIFLPVVIPAFLAPIGDKFYIRWGARKVTTFLFLFGIPAFSCLAFVRQDDLLNRILLCIFLFLSGM
jgi:MFS family permease